MYEDRVLAYFDILGFSEAIKKTIDKDKEIETETKRIDDILENLLDIKRNASLDKSISNKVISYFSDCIAISYPMTEESGIFHIICDILFRCLNILQKGFLMRGAITCDKLYHSEEKIFGPAMIKAVEMEKNLAIYPRIITYDTIFSIAEKYPSKLPSKKEQLRVINKLLFKDFDGLYFINYFDGINYVVGDDGGILVYLESLRARITELREKMNNDEKTKSKYLWLKEKYNTVLAYYKRKYNKKETESPKLHEYLEKTILIEE